MQDSSVEEEERRRPCLERAAGAGPHWGVSGSQHPKGSLAILSHDTPRSQCYIFWGLPACEHGCIRQEQADWREEAAQLLPLILQMMWRSLKERWQRWYHKAWYEDRPHGALGRNTIACAPFIFETSALTAACALNKYRWTDALISDQHSAGESKGQASTLVALPGHWTTTDSRVAALPCISRELQPGRRTAAHELQRCSLQSFQRLETDARGAGSCSGDSSGPGMQYSGSSTNPERFCIDLVVVLAVVLLLNCYGALPGARASFTSRLVAKTDCERYAIRGYVRHVMLESWTFAADPGMAKLGHGSAACSPCGGEREEASSRARSEVKWSQLSPSGSAPSARYGHTAVESTGAGGMLVFGGWGPGSLNDLHLYDPEAGRLKQTAGTADASEV
ncbi:hypothetical protein AK812_SmicGene26923 [Symbiodinium microadriaticum]|uniref:Uncharacterized protein n=1 Tax=Symbiodinium microadriaticum TaxID=2951 RepID=A0A1Q9D868_SYMMI|nr:hypothetical protein AK812_SmicGene26923 [Symbiodinium microadriaticum]